MQRQLQSGSSDSESEMESWDPRTLMVRLKNLEEELAERGCHARKRHRRHRSRSRGRSHGRKRRRSRSRSRRHSKTRAGPSHESNAGSQSNIEEQLGRERSESGG